jgi:hypothetical protein
VVVAVEAIDLAVGVLLAVLVVHPQSLQEHNQFQLYLQLVALVGVLVVVLLAVRVLVGLLI